MIDGDSTDASRVDGLLSTYQKSDHQSIRQKAYYDWSDVAYLFEDGMIP